MARAKFRLTLSVAIFAGVVGALLIFAIVLAFIATPAMPKLDTPTSIKIIMTGPFGETNNASTTEFDKNADATKDQFNKLWKSINKATSFSQLSGALENKWFKNFFLNKVENKDGKSEIKKLSASDIAGIRSDAFNKEYLLVLRYLDGAKRTENINGIDIQYDTVLMLIKDNGVNITPFKMYFIDYYKVFEQSDDIIDDETKEDYVAYEVIAWGRQAEIKNTIEEILEI